MYLENLTAPVRLRTLEGASTKYKTYLTLFWAFFTSKIQKFAFPGRISCSAHWSPMEAEQQLHHHHQSHGLSLSLSLLRVPIRIFGCYSSQTKRLLQFFFFLLLYEQNRILPSKTSLLGFRSLQYLLILVLSYPMWLKLFCSFFFCRICSLSGSRYGTCGGNGEWLPWLGAIQPHQAYFSFRRQLCRSDVKINYAPGEFILFPFVKTWMNKLIIGSFELNSFRVKWFVNEGNDNSLWMLCSYTVYIIKSNKL